MAWVIIVFFSRLFKHLGPSGNISSGKSKGLISNNTTRLVKAGSKVFNPDIGHVIVLEQYQGIYFAIPKVANSSLKTLFADLLGLGGEARHRNGKAYLFNEQASRQKLFAKGILISRSKAVEKVDHWKFAFVRNPWSRLTSFYSSIIRSPHVMGTLTSAYNDMFRPDMPFDAFVTSVCNIPDLVANRHFVSQHRFLVDRRGKIIPNYIGRYESLNEDFQFVCEHLGIESVSISNVNPGKYYSSYQDFYTPSLRDAVAKRYEQDIALLNYKF